MYSPGIENVNEYDSSVSITFDLKARSLAATVCGMSSWLVQVTVVPTFTVTRSANVVGALVVNLTWTGTAALTDYVLSASNGATVNGTTLTIPDGVSSVTIRPSRSRTWAGTA